ncbi:MAG: AAA family ATPase [Deltaproteobacteria bacterium]|nr:AAA family ATPase [Deltaproteobacteria bacterium]
MPLIREVTIENFKSIRTLTMALGRVNVLIGENGSGKSNLLEALVMGCAAGRGREGPEYLAPRGVRVTDPKYMRSAFDEGSSGIPARVHLRDERGVETSVELNFDPSENARFRGFMASMMPRILQTLTASGETRFLAPLNNLMHSGTLTQEDQKDLDAFLEMILKTVTEAGTINAPPDFRIFAPENASLRAFQLEGQTLPLSGSGVGLFAHLKALSVDKQPVFQKITDRLALLDWFEKLEMPQDLAPQERSIRIRDRFLSPGALFDQRSANEGFLFLLFYFTLFISPETPAFFAVDNVDASLNPKLCRALVKDLAQLAVDHGKQVIFTTHNPSVLDGLDLSDEEQRLFVVERGEDGATHVRRVPQPRPPEGESPVKLSDAFLRGYLGGLPNNF